MGVMNVKQTTKAFGQTPDRPTSANANPANLTADELKKLGGENVGEVLNKMSDPNWVDPSKKMRAVGNDKLDKDAFFKLMLAQMKNQDPTNPLKSHEMAAQLANFSSLEQMQNMNSTLTDLKNGQKPMEQFQTLNLIGKAVSGDSSKLVRARGDKEHDIRYHLANDAQEVEVKVRNSDGEVIRTYQLKNQKQGDNKLTWNGLNDKNLMAPAGEYNFFIEAKASNGQKLSVKTDFAGVITGVNYTPEGPVLIIGNQTVRMKDVKKITDPRLMNNDQKTTQDLKVPAEIGQTGDNKSTTDAVDAAALEEGAPEAKPAPQASLMENVGLSRELMTKLEKEVAN